MNIISGQIPSALKVVVYGPEGIGKSTFAAQFPEPLFSDVEGSTKTMNIRRFDRASSWTMLVEQAKYIRSNPTICKTYVVDTTDWAERLCIESVCAKAGKAGVEDFGWGNGYTYEFEEFGRFLNLLNEIIDLGINVVLTAHAQIKRFEQPDEVGAYDRWELKLGKRTTSLISPLVKEWADIVLFANYKTVVVNVDNQGAQKGKNKAQGGQRVMYTAHTPSWDAKNRHGLKDELKFEFSEIAHLFTAPAVVPAPPAPVSQPPEVFYWHHPESSCVLTTPDGQLPEYAVGLVQISKEQYETLKAQYEIQAKIDEVEDKPEPAAPPEKPAKNEKLPKALADLLKLNNVTTEEIQAVVALKGYYPKDTPIANYDPQFITGVLIAAWNQVLEMVKEYREFPFNK